MFDLSRSETAQIQLFEGNLRALQDYEATPLPVPITLFRANAQSLSHLALDSTLGWSQTLHGPLVPGAGVSKVGETPQSARQRLRKG